MKKFNATIVTGVLVSAAAVNITEAATVVRPVMIGVTLDELNVRTGPSTSYKILKAAPKGSSLEVYSESNGWYKVKYSKVEGWVSKKYVKEKLISSPTRYVSGIRREVLREKASTSGSTYGYIYEGEKVKVVDYSGSYARVVYKGKVYYMNSSNLKTSNPAKDMYVSKVAKAKVMETASVTSKVLGEILEGDQVKIVGSKGSFYHVIYNNKRGYIEKKYLTSTNPVSSGFVSSVDKAAVYSEDKKKKLGYIGHGQKVKRFETVDGYIRIRWNGTTALVKEGSCKFSKYVQKVAGATTVKVKESQSSSSKTIATIKKGAVVDVYAKYTDWSKVKIDGKYGYVENKNLIEYKYTLNDKTPLRSSKSTSSNNIVANIPKGTKVIVDYYTAQGWAKVNYGSKSGYILNEHLVRKKPANTESDKVETTKVKIKNEDVNLRDTASWSGKKLITIKKGTSVELVSKGSEWSKVTYQGKTGYVHNDYIDFGGSASKPSEEAKVFVKIKNEDVNLRDAASWSGKKLITIKKGTSVELVSKGSEWSKVTYQGKTGYVHNDYIDFGGSTSKPSEEAKVFVKIKNEDVSLRETSSWSGKKLITIKKGTSVELVSKGSEWSKVTYQGKTGYVHNDYIDFGGSASKPDSGGSQVPDNGGDQTPDVDVPGDDLKYLDTIDIKNPTVNTRYTINASVKVYEDASLTKAIGYLVKGSALEKISDGASNSMKYKINNTVSGYIDTSDVSHRNPFAKNTMSTVPKTLNITHEEYVDSQVNKPYTKIEDVKKYSNPKNFSLSNDEEKYQFLKIDSFRNVNVYELNEYLNDLPVQAGKVAVFKNQAQAFVDAARKHNIDPIYLVAHTLLETGYGSSTLAQGVTVTQDAAGNAVPPTKVYNLFGIGAVDADAVGAGSKTAYALGWTSIPKAIEGAAKWIATGVKADASIGLKASEGYIHSAKFVHQYTLYAMRWDYVYKWHQYASDAQWANKISKRMSALSYLYEGADLVFEQLKYKESPKASLLEGGSEINEVLKDATVRSGPSEGFRSIAKLLKGEIVEIEGYVEDYAIITYDGEDAYVLKSYLTELVKPIEIESDDSQEDNPSLDGEGVVEDAIKDDELLDEKVEVVEMEVSVTE